MNYTLTEGSLDGPANPELIEKLPLETGIALPDSYLQFLLKHNGGEGFIGNRYVIFWKCEELIRFNNEYEVTKYAPNIFLFGSNGGGEGYGFDTELPTMPIIRIPFIGMARSYATPVAIDFPDLFVKLASPS